MGDLYFFIDTSQSDMVVVGSGDQKQLRSVFRRKVVQNEDRAKKFFEIFRKSAKEAHGCVVVTGPGPFSSVRFGVVVANAFGYAKNIPVIGVRRTERATSERLYSRGMRTLLGKKKFQRPIAPFYDRSPCITRKSKPII